MAHTCTANTLPRLYVSHLNFRVASDWVMDLVSVGFNKMEVRCFSWVSTRWRYGVSVGFNKMEVWCFGWVQQDGGMGLEARKVAGHGCAQGMEQLSMGVLYFYTNLYCMHHMLIVGMICASICSM